MPRRPPARWIPVADCPGDDRLWLEDAARGTLGRPGLAAFRVLHPVSRVDDNGSVSQVGWSTLGRSIGRPMPTHGDFPALLGRSIHEFENGFSLAGRYYEPPAQGTLPESLAAPLFALVQDLLGLREITVAVWSGWACVRGYPQQRRPLPGLPGREYFMFRSPITAAGVSVDPWGWQTANVWWNAAEGLLISVDIDAWSTCVRGPTRLLDGLIAQLDLEVAPAAL